MRSIGGGGGGGNVVNQDEIEVFARELFLISYISVYVVNFARLGAIQLNRKN